MRISGVVSSAVLAVALTGAPLMAQEAGVMPAIGMEDAISTSYNQLGLLEYCQAEGHIDGEAIEVQKKVMAMLPAPQDTAKAEEAQAKGAKGVLAVAGTEDMDIAATGLSASEMCAQMAATLVEMGKQLPQ